MPDSIISNLLRSKIVIVFIYLAALALLVYASAFAYQRYQEMLGLKADIATASQPVESSVTKNKPIVSGTQPVAALSLFGKQTKKAVPVAEVIDAPITRLKLTLLGAIAADNAEKSSAIIQIDNKQLAIVQVGDPLPGTNAKIHQIQPTQVVLIRNGKLERLAIIRPELETNAQSDEGELLIKSSGSGSSLLQPLELTGARGKGRPPIRRTTPDSDSLNSVDQPSYPPPPFEMPTSLLPPKNRQ